MTDELMNPLTPDAAAPTVSLPRPRGRARFVVAFLVGLIAALAIGAGALYAFDRSYAGRILPGVHVGGVNLSGLTPEEASSRLDDAFRGLSQGQAVLTSGDTELSIDYDMIGRRADVEA
ncbi:MAG TPA: hypothetical protein VKB00_00135, partial [Candidatus Limnocylindrales bacterium]|nr:hypothetical protein [Candidatus Limnocylindrales bacterium]